MQGQRFDHQLSISHTALVVLDSYNTGSIGKLGECKNRVMSAPDSDKEH